MCSKGDIGTATSSRLMIDTVIKFSYGISCVFLCKQEDDVLDLRIAFSEFEMVCMTIENLMHFFRIKFFIW